MCCAWKANIQKFKVLTLWLLGRSEKHKSLKCQNAQADYIPRHSTDFRIVFGIEIGLLVLCEIRQTYFTEYKGRFETMSRPDLK